MLVNTLKRLAGKGGDPVIQLKTGFGGGKTHSLIALYHLITGANILRELSVDSDMHGFAKKLTKLWRKQNGILTLLSMLTSLCLLGHISPQPTQMKLYKETTKYTLG